MREGRCVEQVPATSPAPSSVENTAQGLLGGCQALRATENLEMRKELSKQ